MSKESDRQAMHFIENETQFHLGFLPTEQSSPLTRNLDREFASGSGKACAVFSEWTAMCWKRRDVFSGAKRSGVW